MLNPSLGLTIWRWFSFYVALHFSTKDRQRANDYQGELQQRDADNIHFLVN